MEHVVLGLLLIRSLTLYEMNQAFKQGISMFYSASYGSLQVAVKNLLGKGWVVFEERVEKGRNKKIYSITEAGRQAFFEWMLAETPTNKLEVTGLSKVFFLGLIPGVEQKRQILQEILGKIQEVQKEMEAVDAAIQQYEVPDSLRGILKYQWKTLDYGRGAHEFARQWFQELLDDLE